MTPPVTVFDCVVYLQAAAGAAGPARACLRLAEEGRILLTISLPIRAELEDVLNRPRLRHRFASLTAEAVALFLQDVSRLARIADDVPAVTTFPRDPKDEPYLDLAVAAQAEYLVTWDNDLLDLMNTQVPENKAFQQQFPRLTVLNPPAFLQMMRAKAGAAEKVGENEPQADWPDPSGTS